MAYQVRGPRDLRFLLCALLQLLVVIVLPVSLANAQGATGAINGTVVDDSGAVVPRVAIRVLNLGTALSRRLTTAEDGRFNIPLLPPGTYTLTAELSGFNTAEIPNLTVNVGDELSLVIRLQIAKVGETVSVVGQPPLLSMSPAVSTVVDRQFIENLPLNGRSFQSLIALTPGMVLTPVTGTGTFLNQGQFSANGQRTTSNSFQIDGVSANFGSTPDFVGTSAHISGNLPVLTTFGTTQGLASIDAMQEFRVQTSTYSAQYGRQPGAQISIVTRSGTNNWRGSLFDYVRNDAFDANDWFASRAGQPKPPHRQNDFGGTLGGPVVLPMLYDGRNQTFFFLSYEGLRLRQPRFQLTNVPTIALRQTAPAALRPILNAFSLPTGRELGNGLAEASASYSDPSTLDATSLRIDHIVNQWSLFSRYNEAPSETRSRVTGVLNRIVTSHIRTRTATIGLNGVVGSRLGQELRMNYSENATTSANTLDDFGGAVPPPPNAFIPDAHMTGAAQSFVLLNFPGRTATGAPLLGLILDRTRTSQRQFNVVEGVSYTTGSHQLKLGFDYRRLMPISALSTYSLSAFFASQQQVLNGVAGTGSVSSRVIAKPRYTNFSAYAQDTMSVSPRLTFDFGLRWEVNPAPGEATGSVPVAVNDIDNLANMQIAAAGTRQWRTRYDNLAPRFGAAYQLSQTPGRETILRGGLGVYYDTGNTQASSGFGTYPFASTNALTNVSFPLVPAQVAPPVLPELSNLRPPYGLMSIFDPDLKLPYTVQWNVTAERAFENVHAVTLSYVGGAGRRLLQRRQLRASQFNTSFTTVNLITNNATSDYNAVHLQFRRRLSRGLQALASYTWARALDDDSADTGTIKPVRGNAAFDIRHTFSGAMTYDLPTPRQGWASALFGHWSVDSIFQARSASPLDIRGVQATSIDPEDGLLVAVRPNVVPGVPFYIEDPGLPGGRRINSAAFSNPPPGEFGNLGRNVVRGFGAWQIDVAVRRQFRLTQRVTTQFRVEAFNVLNHPNFGGIQTSLPFGNFGQATTMLNRSLGGINELYQIGGPRSLQFALKLQF